jgi:hypothetical protein
MSAANALTNLAKAAIGLGAGASLLQASLYNVDGGYRSVMFNRLSGVSVRARKAPIPPLCLTPACRGADDAHD